jgi:hypothetical protein
VVNKQRWQGAGFWQLTFTTKKGGFPMKRAILLLAVFALIGFYALPSWAGPAEDTGRQWIERMAQQDPQLFSEGIVPEVGFLFYIDLMSNASKWASFLVVTNWSMDTRIEIYTSFIPTNGTPSNIVNRLNYVMPNAVAYLDQVALGFTSWGATNWFGIVGTNDITSWVSCGVLLYSSEYGLTWITADGPYTYQP